MAFDIFSEIYWALQGVQASEKDDHVPAKGEAPFQAAAAPDTVNKAAEKKSKKSKSAKTVKDKKQKGAPRGKNAFMFFVMHKRDAVKGDEAVRLSASDRSRSP